MKLWLPWFMVFAQCCMLVGFIICIFSSLMVGSLLVAFGFGIRSTLFPLITNDIATNYSNINLVESLGSGALTFALTTETQLHKLVYKGCGEDFLFFHI